MIRRTRTSLLTVAALAALVGCSAQQPPPIEVVEPNLPYLIGPGDTLSVLVYQNPVLSTPGIPIRPDGRVSLPLVPDLIAAGKTPTEFGHDVEARLKEFVKDPNVSILVQTFVGPQSRQIRVIGEATEPTSIPYRDRMTLLDVMIQTKGLTRYAAGNRAVIVRNYDGKRQAFRVRLSDLIKDGDIDQNVPMAPGDTLIIPQTYF